MRAPTPMTGLRDLLVKAALQQHQTEDDMLLRMTAAAGQGSMNGLAAPSAEHNEPASALGELQAMPADDRAVLVVGRAGAWLTARGVRAGDVVALCAPDSFDMAVTRYVISLIGAVAVTLSPLSSRRELFAQLCGSGARWLITTCDLFVQKLEVAARPTAVMQTFLTGSAAGDATAPGALRFDVLDPFGEAAPGAMTSASEQAATWRLCAAAQGRTR